MWHAAANQRRRDEAAGYQLHPEIVTCAILQSLNLRDNPKSNHSTIPDHTLQHTMSHENLYAAEIMNFQI